MTPPTYEIVIRRIADGWTWAVRLFGETTIRRGRAGNVCVAAIEAAEALEIERACTTRSARAAQRLAVLAAERIR